MLRYLSSFWAKMAQVSISDLGGESGHLLGEHLLLLPRQPVDLVGLDTLGHQLEIGVILKEGERPLENLYNFDGTNSWLYFWKICN